MPATLAKERVRQTYTLIAPFHDILAVLVEAKARRLGIKLAGITDGEDVLEVAVGTGLSFHKIVAQNPNGTNVAVDITPAMIKKTKRRVRKIRGIDTRVEIGDAYSLDFPDGSFDLVINSYMLDMVPIAAFPTVLREFARVLKPTGRLVLINMALPRRWYNKVWNTLYRVHPFFLGGCRGVAIRSYLASAELDCVEYHYVSEKTFPSEVLLCRHTGSTKTK